MVGIAAPSGGDVGDLVTFSGVNKTYGSSRALASADLSLRGGEILGLVGHNGAGKTTLMRILTGITAADSGSVIVGGQAIQHPYGTPTARQWGIRMAFQELSLCPTLRVFENTVVGHPALGGVGWRGRCRRLITEQLDRVFPGHGISAGSVISELSLAQRQMVEIAEAIVPDGLPIRVLVLDEPTSALGGEPARQLFDFLREAQRSEGLSVIVISHRLGEILANTDRVAVMRDGTVVGTLSTRDASASDVLGLMGATSEPVSTAITEAGGLTPVGEGEPLVALRGVTTRTLHGVTLQVRPGEIVGLAGLEGEGQHELLLAIWRESRRKFGRRDLRVSGTVGYVTGDRQSAGVFHLWSVAQNVSVNSLRRLARWGIISAPAERLLVSEWTQRLAIAGSPERGIGELSGGNQQKALLARALASNARLILLNDPFRGVDVRTKQQAYAHARGSSWGPRVSVVLDGEHRAARM